MRNETILNVFPSSDHRHRLVVAVQQSDDFLQDGGAASRLVLRQETHSDDVGWFVQSCVAIEPEQLPGLKMALSGNSARKLHPPAREIPRVPAILRFHDRPTSSVG